MYFYSLNSERTVVLQNFDVFVVFPQDYLPGGPVVTGFLPECSHVNYYDGLSLLFYSRPVSSFS